MILKPMLAAAAKDVNDLPYPLIASRKLDGIRCLKIGGKVVSRSLKPIPNDHIRTTLEAELPDGADGELIFSQEFTETTSAVMRKSGVPAFGFWMFDYVPVSTETPYHMRLNLMHVWFNANRPKHVSLVVTHTVSNAEELLDFEEEALADGHEGVCMRTPDSPYKNGRSTLKQAWLLKLKRFVDSEAEVLGTVEQMANLNAKKTNALGRSERSSHKAGKVGKNTLGKFLVRDIYSGVEFKIGTGEGLTDVLRQHLWNIRDTLPGKILKYKSQPHGVKDKPRIPIFIGWRDAEDMS